MRWPFGRTSPPGDGSANRAPDSGADPAIVRPRDAWRSLPVIQRVVGRPPTVAPARPFADQLATRQAPALALQPLGHEISSLASPGLVAGVVTPVGAAHSSRVDLPLQRAVEGGPGAEPEAVGWSSFEATGPVAPLHEAPAGDRVASGENPVRPITVQRLAVSEPVLTSSATMTVAAAPAGTLDLRPAGPAVADSPRAAALPQARVRDTVPGAPAPDPAMPEPPVRRPTLGQARRLGLGAPLGSALSSAVQRDAQPASGVPAGDPLGVTLAGLAGDPARASADQAVASTPPGWSSLPAGSPAPASGAPRPDQRSSEPGALPVVRPISIQRLATIDPVRSFATWTGEPVAAPAAGLPLVVVPSGSSAVAESRDQGPAGPGPTGAWSGTAAGTPNEVPDADSTRLISPLGGGPMRVSSSGSLLMPAASGAGHEAVRVAASGRSSAGEPVVARSVADPGRTVTPGGLPSGRTASGFEGARRSEPAGTAVMRTLVRTGAPTAGSDPQVAAQPAAITMPVQRAVQINELEIRPTPADPAPGNGSSNGAGTGQAGGPGAAAAASPVDRDRELDDLARHLYGRIRSRLSAELLADRERAGMITDLR